MRSGHEAPIWFLCGGTTPDRPRRTRLDPAVAAGLPSPRPRRHEAAVTRKGLPMPAPRHHRFLHAALYLVMFAGLAAAALSFITACKSSGRY